MTTVEILYRYNKPLSDSVSMALAATRDVYGIRHLHLDPASQTLRVEYDATRLTPAAVTRLICLTGLGLAEELPLITPPPSAPEPAPAA